MSLKSYSELLTFSDIGSRYDYLRIGALVGSETFGFDRYLNQAFYASSEWRKVRDKVILRDDGCDLAIPIFRIGGRIYIHHMNPITEEQIQNRDPMIFDPEFLICCSFDTHNAIHFGDDGLLPKLPIDRKPGDTCLWR